MNPLDLYELDQKSWSFLDLIGQPPLTLNIINISASGNISVVTLTASVSVVAPLVDSGSGNLTFQVAANPSNRWFMDTAGVLWPVADNLFEIGRTTQRIARIFARIIDSGTAGSLSLGTNQVTRITIANTGQLYPATDAAAAQTASGIFAGTGVPNNANGNNGDFYLRSDGGAGTCIYQRRAGAWVATGA